MIGALLIAAFALAGNYSGPGIVDSGASCGVTTVRFWSWAPWCARLRLRSWHPPPCISRRWLRLRRCP